MSRYLANSRGAHGPNSPLNLTVTPPPHKNVQKLPPIREIFCFSKKICVKVREGAVKMPQRTQEKRCSAKQNASWWGQEGEGLEN